MHLKNICFFFVAASVTFSSCAQSSEKFTKLEKMITMRDGAKLYTAIYVPKKKGKFPFLIERTPYSCSPYGEKNYPSQLGPSRLFSNDDYIYVYQDVRGRYMSEGKFEEMTPYVSLKLSNKDVDESSDSYDTIDWLLKSISNNNGKAGMYGISYPGFYATASLPNAHPALKAVSPQAPVTDEFEGDDAYHRGAFFLMDNYSFMNGFDYPRNEPWKSYPRFCTQLILNAYSYYLNLGAIKNANEQCFDNKSKIWNEYLLHDSKDDYWKARDIRKHLHHIKPAVLVVGGWFDAEDLFGSLHTYKAIENRTPRNNSRLIMGPWTHGSWARTTWNQFGSLSFGSNTSEYFQKMEHDFFNFYLNGSGSFNAAEATIFETGSNQWKNYDSWPPKQATPTTWFLQNNHSLSFDNRTEARGSDSYVSDPADPVPYMDTRGGRRNDEYMVADQTFATERKDVLFYESPELRQDIILSGPITAELFASVSTTDADFVVKVIDVLPDTARDADGRRIGGMQRLVRAEILRGKFRNNFSVAKPFEPNKITKVKLVLNDVAHCFKQGHKIMIQIQSSWFPLVDRNPQKFLSIGNANDSDFQKATITIFHDRKHPSSIKVLQMN